MHSVNQSRWSKDDPSNLVIKLLCHSGVFDPLGLELSLAPREVDVLGDLCMWDCSFSDRLSCRELYDQCFLCHEQACEESVRTSKCASGAGAEGKATTARRVFMFLASESEVAACLAWPQDSARGMPTHLHARHGKHEGASRQ